MTQTFVRYSPAVEQNEPGFERTVQQVLDDMKQHMRGSLKTEAGLGLADSPVNHIRKGDAGSIERKVSMTLEYQSWAARSY
jgi:hypothetical protein